LGVRPEPQAAWDNIRAPCREGREDQEELRQDKGAAKKEEKNRTPAAVHTRQDLEAPCDTARPADPMAALHNMQAAHRVPDPDTAGLDKLPALRRKVAAEAEAERALPRLRADRLPPARQEAAALQKDAWGKVLAEFPGVVLAERQRRPPTTRKAGAWPDAIHQAVLLRRALGWARRSPHSSRARTDRDRRDRRIRVGFAFP